jgi:hypothetical protein
MKIFNLLLVLLYKNSQFLNLLSTFALRKCEWMEISDN